MLGKLIKNEFKSTAHFLIPVYAALAISLGMSGISLIWKSDLMSALSSLILAIIGFALIIVTFVCIVINFNKSLYGAQGYLSFTLPVKSKGLLGSKAIVSFVWMLLSFIILIAIFLGIYVYVRSVAVDQYGTDTLTTVKSFLTIYADLPNMATVIKIIILFAVSVFADLLLIIMSIYFSVSFANTRQFQKHSIVWSLVFFFGVRIAIKNIIVKLACKALPFMAVANSAGLNFATHVAESGNKLFAVNITEAIVQIIAIIGLFFATDYLMKSKVNVK